MTLARAMVGGAGDVPTVKGRRLPGGRYPRHVIDRPYVEHPDGTVSVEGPLRFDGREGFLEHGVWRKA